MEIKTFWEDPLLQTTSEITGKTPLKKSDKHTISTSPNDWKNTSVLSESHSNKNLLFPLRTGKINGTPKYKQSGP